MTAIERDEGQSPRMWELAEAQAKSSGWRSWAIRRALVLIAAANLTAGAAYAQSYYDRSSVTDVTTRAHPEYDAVGEHVGAFTVYPRASLTEIYDDNVYALPQKTAGAILTLAPSLDVSSNWGRNAFSLHLQYERDQYFDQPGESSNEYSMNSNTSIDLDGRSKLTFTLGAAQLTEPRTDADSIEGVTEPVRYDVINAGAAGYREFGRFRLDLSAATNYYSFYNVQLPPGVYNISGNDIVAIGNNLYYNEASRDETATSETVRLSWAIDPNIAIFTQLQPNQSSFIHEPVGVLGSYNSTGYEILAGVNGQLTHLVRYDAGVGYLEQHYSSALISDVTGLAFNVDTTYDVTQLITLKVSGNHSIQAAGIPGSAAADVDSVSTRADYELLRNLIIYPYFSYYHYIYPGTKRIDSRYADGVNATFLINSLLGLTASYSYIQQTSAGGFGGYNFNDNRVSLALTVQR